VTFPHTAAPVTPTTRAEDLFSALEELGRAQRGAGANLARRLDWPRAGLGVMHMLAACGPVQLSDVAAKLRVDVSVASRQVSQLVDAGYVHRMVDDDDRRVRLLELTESGRALAEQMAARYSELFAAAFTGWSDQDVADAAIQIRRVAAAITTIHEEGTH
jgi:DNA-binding MarR family transcriptional regulator